MPISDKNMGKYGRPDIYIEEIDASVVDLPFQDVLINFVPGFSKKGPVNRPIQVTTKGDFIKIFGEIDKSLERKGSYFHRTCLKMLESSPIWALNLLSTDDTRDKLNWKAVSLASQYDNASVKEMPYSKIFNRQDFWKRDTDALLDYVTFDNNNAPDTDRLLYLTNVGDKVSTTFIFKSSAKGFDVTLEDWYGGITKVPSYLHYKDWASDYLVTVVVLEGDWTNYNNLSVDTVWSKYFNVEGLLKSNVTTFLNESNVKVLAYYDVSLIPYFKDLNNNVMYIKSVINNDTDKSGIFCAMNEEYLMDSDIPTGSLDIIGSTLVNTDKSVINYLSYNENITENVTYPMVDLNSNGNAFGNKSTLSGEYAPGTDRKMDKTDGYFEGITLISTGSTLIQVNRIVHSANTAPYWLDVALTNDGNPSPFGPQTGLSEYDPITFTNSFDNIVAYKTYYVESTSQGDNMIRISETKGGDPLLFTRTYTFSELALAGLFLQKMNLGISATPSNYYNIDGGKYTLDSGATFVNIEPLTLTINGTTVTPVERYDILYLSKGDNTVVNIIKGSQAQSDASKPSFNYDMKDYIILGYIKLQTESGVTPLIPSTNTKINLTYYPVSLTYGSGGAYINFTDITITDGIVSGSNFIRFEFGGSSGTTDATNYNQTRIRNVYNTLEAGLSQGKGLIINRITGKKLELTISSMTFIDYGTTNNAVITIMIGSEVASEYYSGSNFLFYFIDNEFVITHPNTDRLLTSNMPVTALAGSGQTLNAGVIGKYSALYLDYYDGIINNWDTVFVHNVEGNPTKIYLKSWFQGTKLYIDFVSDTSGISPLAIDDFSANYNSQLIIWSQKANYKQTIEIETVDISKGIDTIFEFSVDKTRYSEVTKGTLLEGYYVDEFGGTRKLVRVIKTIQDPNNVNNKIIKTDGPVALTSFSGATVSDIEYSTTMYPSMDVYVNTYKGIKLVPFKIHADSIPNKTDIRQSEILDVLDINKNLAKGLVNKDKISWRYLIDSFGLGLTDRSKQQLVDLCGAKLNCLGFISMPSIKDFKKSDNPMFLDSDGLIDTALIKAGGDESKSPSFLYTFADGVGASCAAYFIPYITINDDGIPMSFPPAAYAATTYMKKFNTSQAGIEAWTISAGINNGQVIGVGDTEMDFNNDQLLDMAEMGANPFVKKKDVGICINTEYTAKRYPYSSLSVIHSRELLIDLENRLYDMLLRYQWKFNTAEIRAEIKYKADKICKDLQERDGIYDFQNIIDETNNTNYIIDLGMGVLDTSIEIIKGMGVIVNNITILKKGSIQSGGFQ